MKRTFKKKPTILAAIAALFIGAVLGSAGYSAWKPQRLEPLFSFDPAQVKEISVFGGEGSGWSSKWNGISYRITDEEQIKRVVELLNGFTYDRTASFYGEPNLGCGSYLSLSMANGERSIPFSTHDDGTPDTVAVSAPDCIVTYYTSPGYLWEIAEIWNDR